jgi:predicted amino acid racemase
MFLEKTMERNPGLIDCAFDLHARGLILPDTYILDLDAIEENARAMKEEADRYGIDLYFMLKQIGRNPLIAAKLMEIGFRGAVCVDFKEALTMIDNGIHIANVGHLVQIPKAAMKKILSAGPDYVTIYSNEIIREIDETCEELGRIQKVLIRLSDGDSTLYSGQEGGFHSSELEELYQLIGSLKHVELGGFTVFPALLYSEEEGRIVPTDNIRALNRGLQFAEEKGLKDLNINLPSASCSASIPLISELHGTSGEPGHGLTGTTPLHKHSDQPEKPAYVYVSEISHSYEGRSFCYGGGHYRRSHMENVLVGRNRSEAQLMKVIAPSEESIDYHYEIKGRCEVGDCAVMAYRTQVFTTRSQVAVVKGIQKGEACILGIYDALGERIRYQWDAE